MKDIDKQIVIALLNPEQRPCFKIKLLEDTFKYFCRLDDTLELFHLDYFSAVKNLNETGLLGEPEFVNTTYDRDLLKIIYSWSQDDLDELQNNIRSTRYTWSQIQTQLDLNANSSRIAPTVTALNLTISVTKRKRTPVKKKTRRLRKIERLEKRKEERKNSNLSSRLDLNVNSTKIAPNVTALNTTKRTTKRKRTAVKKKSRRVRKSERLKKTKRKTKT